MKELAPPIARLVEELQRLPGVGRKTAQRLAFHLLRQPTAEAERLAQAILDAKQNLLTCSVCHNITEQDPCGFCTSSTRNHKQICVVESAQDILNVERTRSYQGLYHVLGGVLSPLQGMGPDQLNLKSLLERLKGDSVEEIIVATNPNAEGEATALYLSKLIKPLGVRITRLAMGLPAGGELEYADQITMTRALEGRREL